MAYPACRQCISNQVRVDFAGINISLTFYTVYNSPSYIDDILKCLIDFNKLVCVVELFGKSYQNAPSPNDCVSPPIMLQ